MLMVGKAQHRYCWSTNKAAVSLYRVPVLRSLKSIAAQQDHTTEQAKNKQPYFTTLKLTTVALDASVMTLTEPL